MPFGETAARSPYVRLEIAHRNFADDDRRLARTSAIEARMTPSEMSA
jgi:hypothetical protein